jgi:hypothetical protein
VSGRLLLAKAAETLGGAETDQSSDILTQSEGPTSYFWVHLNPALSLDPATPPLTTPTPDLHLRLRARPSLHKDSRCILGPESQPCQSEHAGKHPSGQTLGEACL